MVIQTFFGQIELFNISKADDFFKFNWNTVSTVDTQLQCIDILARNGN